MRVCVTGYGNVLSYEGLSFDPETDISGPVPFWLDDLVCHGNETALSVCPHSMWGTHDCSSSQDVGLNCAGKRIS